MRGSRGRVEPRLDDPNIMIDEGLIKTSFNYADKLHQSFPNADIIYLGPFVEYRLNPSKQVRKPESIPINSIELFEKLEGQLVEYSRSFRNVSYVAFNELGQIPVSPFVDDCFIWRDGDHLSMCGEKMIGLKLSTDAILSGKNKR